MENSNKEATITSEQAWFNINKDNNMTISVIPSNTKIKEYHKLTYAGIRGQ